MPHIDSDAREWVEYLAEKLSRRASDIALFDDYYTGNHRLQFTTSDFREAFGTLLEEYADNWCRIIVDAAVERLTPTGFRFPPQTQEGAEGSEEDDEAADADAWRIWQANKLTTRIQVGFVESMVNSASYLLVWFPPGTEINEDGNVDLAGGMPRISIEHPSEVIVEYAPGDRDTRLAALKMWGVTGDRHATLYLPDRIVKFTEEEKLNEFGHPLKNATGDAIFEWVPDEEQSGPNPLGVVPVVPLVNRPRLLRPDGESELVEVIPNQDAINKLAKDMLVASEFGAFPQRYAVGVERPVDPETNEPIKDSEWAPNVKRFLTTPNPEAKVGALPVVDLSNFVSALDNRVNSIASQTRTPPHYLNASADRLSGESMKAAEAGLVARVREKMEHYGEALVEAMQLAFRVLGDPRADLVGAEVLWRDPESRTEAQHVDAVVKKFQARLIPWQVAVEDLDYSPTKIARMRQQLRQEALEFGFGADLEPDEELADTA